MDDFQGMTSVTEQNHDFMGANGGPGERKDNGMLRGEFPGTHWVEMPSWQPEISLKLTRL